MYKSALRRFACFFLSMLQRGRDSTLRGRKFNREENRLRFYIRLCSGSLYLQVMSSINGLFQEPLEAT